jgi:hypothetical protein
LSLEFERGKNTFGRLMLFYITGFTICLFSTQKGVANHWSGIAKMAHYTSDNLWDWKYEGYLKLEDNVIDATLLQLPGGTWRMWYKWNNILRYANSDDLFNWTMHAEPAINDQAHEGAKYLLDDNRPMGRYG